MPNSSPNSSSGSASPKTNSEYNMGLLVPIIGTTILLIMGGICCCWMHRKWKKSGRKGQDPNSYRDRTLTISFSQLDQPIDFGDIVSPRAIQSVRPFSGQDHCNDRSVRLRDAYELDSDSGWSYMARILQQDRNLARKRIPHKDVKLRSRLSTSRNREVRLGEYRTQPVVVKRLLKSKRSQIGHIHEFVYHVQLRSTLDHPNIVALVGVAWTSVTDAMMVMEHLSVGDLGSYLDRCGEYISWEHGKYRLAIDICRAVVYLHSRPTAVVHGDLRASNVLLTASMRSKLSGFDSCCLNEEILRCHVTGAPFWSAPEVLRGEPHTTKSDIYAFGVLLTELDTAKCPFHDALSPIGTKLKPVQVLNEVMQGTLRPSFSPDCPRRVRVIGVGCYQQDPSRRPTADQLQRLLEA